MKSGGFKIWVKHECSLPGQNSSFQSKLEFSFSHENFGKNCAKSKLEVFPKTSGFQNCVKLESSRPSQKLDFSQVLVKLGKPMAN